MSTLTTAYVHHIEERILERQKELDARLHAAVLAATGEASGAAEVRDMKDAAAEDSDAAFDDAALAQAARERDELAAALRRIRQGSYGDCADCGRPIPVHRLEAMPAAALCAECQGRHEHAASHWRPG
ncbi:TraR/DksA family transcriptional regulator [Ramlibacter sp. MMS24-I3-19]|uniref:TraR/DksA family transcriptional regulator n=1 Tax=Ramlibacter sp. MMS24-I3-19 TaxID=3416606 RepID=UPI003D02D4E9